MGEGYSGEDGLVAFTEGAAARKSNGRRARLRSSASIWKFNVGELPLWEDGTKTGASGEFGLS